MSKQQKFSKKELERLQCSEEEVKLVMEYQRKLPVLNRNKNCEKFCVNTRELHTQLGVGRDYSTWIKSRVKKYGIYENIDYILRSPNRGNAISSGGTNAIDYVVTLDVAKTLCMVENNDLGSIARKYFILMEDLIDRNKQYIEVRNPQKANYKPMCEALSSHLNRMVGRSGDDFDFAREADTLNIIACGNKAQAMRLYFNVNDKDLTRDSLYMEYNEKLAFLQDQNILLLSMDMKRQDRLTMLILMFDAKYPNAKAIKEYQTREDLIDARKCLFEK